MEDQCFIGHMLGICENKVKRRNQESVKAYSTQRFRRKAHLPIKPRPQTFVDVL